jgi:hypothetical protein
MFWSQFTKPYLMMYAQIVLSLRKMCCPLNMRRGCESKIILKMIKSFTHVIAFKCIVISTITLKSPWQLLLFQSCNSWCLFMNASSSSMVDVSSSITKLQSFLQVQYNFSFRFDLIQAWILKSKHFFCEIKLVFVNSNASSVIFSKISKLNVSKYFSLNWFRDTSNFHFFIKLNVWELEGSI